MANKKKIEVIEVKPNNLKTIESVLAGMKSHFKPLPFPLEVNPYRVIYSFNNKLSFGHHIAGGYNFLGEFRDGFVYTVKAEKSDDSLVLYEPVLGYYDHTIFGTEHIKDLERAKKRLKEKSMEVAKKVVLEELVDSKTFPVFRGGTVYKIKAEGESEKKMEKLEKFSRCYIFDATNLDEKEKQELKEHPFFKIFLH